MAMEVSCGNCNGRLLVETFGVIVACPHCGVHLSIPEPDATPPYSVPPAGSSPVIQSPPPETSPPAVDAALATTPPNPIQEAPVQPTHKDSPIDTSRAETGVYTGAPSPVPNLAPKPSLLTDSPSSIFHSAEDEAPASTASENVGWLSSPNLSLMDVPDPRLERFPPAAANGSAPAIESMPSPSTAGTESPIDPPVAPTPEVAPVTTTPLATVMTEPVAVPSIPGAPSLQEAPHVTAVTAEQPPPAFGDFADFSLVQSVGVEAAVTNVLNAVTDMKPVDGSFAGMIPAKVPASYTSESLTDDSNSQLTFYLMILGSYASLATIILIYLFFFNRAHQLESLPDLKTAQQLGGRLAVPKPENNLPPGHDLRFGQTQRFGNVLVTPLKVTRGPIAFEHQNDKSEQRTPSEPVLKLWLKFENVSAKEAITPLDTTLMFFRRVLDHRITSFNVIFRQEDRKKKNPQLWYPFDRMAVDTEWLIVGQHTNEPLEAHKSFETFVPSEEGADGLTGELVWRVHFRKGYGPRTGNGVTTLIDVHFHSDDIKQDAS